MGGEVKVTKGSWTTGGVRSNGWGGQGRGAGKKVPGGARASPTHLLVAALVEIVVSGWHAQGGLVYLETQKA